MSIRSTDHRYARRAQGDLWLTVHGDDDVPARAALVYLHGGGWAGGDRSPQNLVTRLLPLTQRGILIVSADYRLTDAAVWPAQLEDAGDVLEWVAESYGGLPIFTSGSSAGGHLAGLVGLGAWEKLTGRRHRREAAGVITYAAVSDPLQWDEERLQEPLPAPGTFAHWAHSRHGQWPPGGLGRKLLDGADSSVSPRLYNHVGTDPVPFVIIHGDSDTCVSYRESVQLFETLSSRGGDALLLEIAGADHEDPRFDTPVVRGLIAAFIDHHGASSVPFVEQKGGAVDA